MRAQSPIRIQDGLTAGDYFGWAVAGVGDLDGDHVPDLALGAPQADFGRGRVELRSGADGSLLRALQGSQPGELFGWSLAAAGDLDGDGHPDVLIGAPGEPSAGLPGSAEAYSGFTGALLLHFDGLSDGDRFGYAVAGLGDLDGDLVPDLLIGAAESSGPGFYAGSARVLSGADGSLLHAFQGAAAGKLFGSSVAAAGDLDGDGVGDCLIGAPGMGNQRGSVSAFSGATGAALYVREGDELGDRFGHSLAGAFDVDGDGTPDWIAGAPSGGAQHEGLASVRSGFDGGPLHTFRGSATGDRFGWAVCAVGDVNLDGLADLAVGAPTSWSGAAQGGSVQLFDGAAGTHIYTLHQGGDLAWFGASLGAAGDPSRDGIPDFLVGAPFEGAGAIGRVHLLQGLDELAPRYCFGDGSQGACGCGNSGAPRRGCANSAGSGALLSSIGSASLSVAADDLVLSASQLVPDQPTLLFAGRNQLVGGAGQPFGDGLRCAGGDVVRLGVQMPTATTLLRWGPGLAAANGWSAGESWNFQVWYRDPAGPCGIGFNLSNGVAVQFAP